MLKAFKQMWMVLLLCCFFIAGCQQNSEYTNCSKFRNGKYIFNFKINNKAYHYLIYRNNNIQIEKNLETKEVTKLKVEWIDSCIYKLKFIGSTIIDSPKTLAMRKNNILTTRILSTTNSYYTFITTSSLSSFEFADTIWLSK